MLGRAVIIFGVLAWTASATSADSDADEFARVFKQPRRAQRAPVMLIVDGVAATSDEPLLLDLSRPTGPPTVPAAPIVSAVGHRLNAPGKSALLAAIVDHQLSLEALRGIGLEVTYDPSSLELRIIVPPLMTRAVRHDLRRGDAPDLEGALAPSAVSGYINLRGGASTAQSPVDLHTDAVLNVDGWLLQGRADLAFASVSGRAPVAVHRGDVLLSRDVAADAVRYMAGDFATTPTGLQPSYPILGVGVARNFSLQPYRMVRPVGSFDFVLEQASKVTVLVNGTAVQTLSLPAGRHDIRDLPLGAGVNAIELLIKGERGIERRIAFSTASPDALLAPGISQFSFGLGFPLVEDVGLRTYDYERPVLSGRRRWGVTTGLTVGGSFDAELEHQVAAAEVTVASTLGALSLDTASSHHAVGAGVAVGARYGYTRVKRGAERSVAVIGHHYSSAFRTLGPVVTSQFKSDAAISATRTLGARFTGRLDARYQVGRERSDAQDVTVGVTRSFGRLGLDARVSARHDRVQGDELRMFVTARWSLSGRRGSMHAGTRASSRSGVGNDLSYRRAADAAGGLGMTLGLAQTQNQVAANAGVDYTGERFVTSVGASSTDHLHTGDSRQVASIEVATALAFAGGRMAWSRPINGSFAIVERHATLKGVPVGVNPVRGGYLATTDSFGLAVVPNLEAYRLNTLTVEAPNLPAGYSLGAESRALVPTYKSGTLVRVGEDSTVFVRGTAVDAAGAPLAFAVGELTSLDEPSRAPLVLMTNRVGRFSVIGLRPGRHAIRISGAVPSAANLVIPAGTTGIHTAGTIVMR